jgi:hypothetical protein
VGEVVKTQSTVNLPTNCDPPTTTIRLPAIDAGFAMLTARFDPAMAQAALVSRRPASTPSTCGCPAPPIRWPSPCRSPGRPSATRWPPATSTATTSPSWSSARRRLAGTTDAGAVYIYRYVAGAFMQVSTDPLQVSSPSAGDLFGKSLAIAPWGKTGRNVLVVGGEGKVFTYFRLPGLYDDDVRTGR